MDTLSHRLAEARDQNQLVRLEKSCASGHADGFVVALGPVWGILQVVDDSGRYAGFEAFRQQDLGTLTAPSPHAAFLGRVLARRGLERPALPALALDNLTSLLDGLSWDFPLLTLHREIADPDVCHIGAVAYYTDEVVGLREIDCDANWDEEATEYPLAEITRIDFGTPYETALELVSAAAPTDATQQLAEAMRLDQIVKIDRNGGDRRHNGFVAGLGAEWGLLLLVDDDIEYGGFLAFRLDDVVDVEAPAWRQDFYKRALELRGSPRPDAPALDLDGLPALLRDAAARFGLLTVFRESIDPEVFYVGELAEVSAERIGLRQLDAEAAWMVVEYYDPAEISLVEFGTPYQQALALAADDN